MTCTSQYSILFETPRQFTFLNEGFLLNADVTAMRRVWSCNPTDDAEKPRGRALQSSTAVLEINDCRHVPEHYYKLTS